MKLIEIQVLKICAGPLRLSPHDHLDLFSDLWMSDMNFIQACSRTTRGSAVVKFNFAVMCCSYCCPLSSLSSAGGPMSSVRVTATCNSECDLSTQLTEGRRQTRDNKRVFDSALWFNSVFYAETHFPWVVWHLQRLKWWEVVSIGGARIEWMADGSVRDLYSKWVVCACVQIILWLNFFFSEMSLHLCRLWYSFPCSDTWIEFAAQLLKTLALRS